jgi:hypothetical protein
MTTEQWNNDNIQLLAWLNCANPRIQKQARGIWNGDHRFLRSLAMEQSPYGSRYRPRNVDPILGHPVSAESRLQQLDAPRISSREPPQQQSTVSGIPGASLASQNAAFRLVAVGSDLALSLNTTTPGPDDVMFGRGKTTNRHGGNKRFRSVVAEHRQEYQAAAKKQKTLISREVMQIIQQRGGRFLQKNKAGFWEPVKDAIAREKTSQALRDRAADPTARMNALKLGKNRR